MTGTTNVVSSSPSSPKRAPFVILVLAVLALGLCILLALNTAAAADEVRQRSLNAANADTEDTNQQLQVDVANKQAPAALASAARAIGLIPDPHPAFLIVRPDGSVVVMGSALPATAAPDATPTASPVPSPTATPTSGAQLVKPTVATTVGASPSPSIPISTLPGGPR